MKKTHTESIELCVWCVHDVHIWFASLYPWMFGKLADMQEKKTKENHKETKSALLQQNAFQLEKPIL